MDELELLISALGIAALAGINLYLTVFVISIAIHYNLIALDPGMHGLQMMGHPAIMVVAGVLYAIEFFADKVPWLDTLWDSVHTVIRPIGAAFLGLGVVGTADPVVATVAALLCGGVGLTSHLSKSSARLFINTSPEPFTNSLASLIEDGLVLAGLLLSYFAPLLLFVLLVAFLVLFFYFAPRVLRFVIVTTRFIFFKLTSIGQREQQIIELPRSMPKWLRERLQRDFEEKDYLVWAVPIFTGRMRRFPANRRGYLCYVLPSDRLALVVRREAPFWLARRGVEMKAEEKLLFEEITLSERREKGRPKWMRLRFPKHLRSYFLSVQADLESRAAQHSLVVSR